MSQPPVPLDPGRQRDLVAQIGQALSSAVPPRWRQVRVDYRAAGRHVEVDVVVTTLDGRDHPARPHLEAVRLLGVLRGGMYRPGRGTWLSATLLFTPQQPPRLEFRPDVEPRWRQPPPPLGFQDELRFFPRADAFIPPWLRARAGLPPLPAQGTPGAPPVGHPPAPPAGPPHPGPAPSGGATPPAPPARPFATPAPHGSEPETAPPPDTTTHTDGHPELAAPAQDAPEPTPPAPQAGPGIQGSRPGSAASRDATDSAPAGGSTPPAPPAPNAAAAGEPSSAAPQEAAESAAPASSASSAPRSDTAGEPAGESAGESAAAPHAVEPERPVGEPAAPVPGGAAGAGSGAPVPSGVADPAAETAADVRTPRIYDGLDDAGRPVVERERLAPEERERVLAYLEAAPAVLASRSYGTDAFDPARTDVVPMVFRTDGSWAWPGAVAYYLREHDIPPDPELLSHIRGRRFAVPEVGEPAREIALAAITGEPG